MGRVNHPTLTPARTSKVAQRVVYVLLASFLSFIIPAVVAPQMAHAASAAPICAAGVGQGGAGTSNYLTTDAGNGCVIIKYVSGGSTFYENFNHTGVDQSWTVPTGVTSATFYLIGAGGGGGIYAGGGGGYASGSYSLTSGQVLKIIVGQGGGGVAAAAVTGYVGKYTPLTYGGGGRGGSYGSAGPNWYSSGGGRSAVRLPSASTDLVTAGGGGGGSYSQCGFGGGGESGLPATKSVNSGTGGTQTAGGTGGPSINGYPGTNGAAYLGGDSKDEGGGGGGGYFGGGGGGDNYGGGGGSSYIALLTGGLTNAGGNCGAAGLTTGLSYVVTYNPNNATSGSAPGNTTVALAGQTLTLATNSGTLARTGYTFAGWNTQADGSGTNYAVSATTFPISGDVTLYAQWNSVITYSANGATSGTVPATETIIGNATATLAGNTGTLAINNGVLLGWNTNANGTGSSFALGQTSYAATGNLTLYAMWGPKACTPNAGYSNCAVFPKDKQNLSYTLPTNVPVGTILQVEVWGAGGGVNGGGAVGGGAGGYSKVSIPVQAVGETFTVVTGQAGARSDFVGTYGGGGAAGGASSLYPGGSGGGMSGLFSGDDLTKPLVISGGGGGASQGNGATAGSGGGGGAGHAGNARGTVLDTAISGSPGTTSAGGAAASNLSPCDGVDATAGSKYQGGRGAGSASGTEAGGGGGGGYYGGGGGRCQVTSGPVQNGGGGGGSGYFDPTRVTVVTVEDGSNSIAGQASTGGTTSTQYVTGIGLGGGINNSGAAGDGLVVIQWNTATYTVTFDKGTGSAVTATPVTQSVPGANVTIAGSGSATKTGYTLSSWNTAAALNGTTVALGSSYFPTANTTLYAVYTANNYNITFDSNSATGTAATGTMAQEAIVAGTAKALTGNAFARTGYVFNGWNTSADGSGTSYVDLASVTLYGNTTLYAQWLVTITYDGNNKTAGTVPAATNVVPGAPTTLAGISTTLTRTNYTFAGWNTAADGSGTSYVYGATGFTTSSAITLYAQWNSTITYNANGSISGSVPSVQTATGSAPVTLSKNTGSLAKNTYFFAGWNTLANGTGKAYPQNSSYISTGNVILYAQWVSACVVTTTSSSGYKILTFSGVGLCYWAVPAGVTSIDTLIVGGGGGGGSNLSGGGGGGQVVRTDGISVSGGYIINVGAGGAGGTGPAGATSGGIKGGDSYIDFGTSISTALGGNGGRGRYTAPLSTGGYTGGGGSFYDATYPTTKNPNTGSGGTGVDGGTGGISGAGGGGAGGPGYSAGNGTGLTAAGGVGLADSISGTSTYYGGGGGAAKYGTTTSWTGAGGLGGGGQALAGGGTAGAGTNGLGGGGAGDYGGVAGGAGGSGVVIIRYTALYTVTFDPNTASSGAATSTTLSQTTPAQVLTLASKGTLLKTGYTFAGWDTSSTATTPTYLAGASYTPQGNDTLYAIWTANSYAITFNANGATGSMANESIVAGTAIALSANTLTRTGYTFNGWNTLAEGGGTAYVAGATVTLYANLTLYAQWTANTYAVTFASNTATGCLPVGCLSMANQSFTAGTAFTLSTNTWYKTGYTFAGWSTSSGVQAVLYSDAQSVTLFGNTTIYAQWTANVYVVSYSANGGTGAPSAATQNYTFGSAAITTFPTVGTMAKTGYSFGGWSTTASGTTALTTLTPAASQTVYAIWTPQPQAVTFNGNGSTSGSMTNQSITAGTATALTANSFSRTGYSFAGWNSSADGTGTTSYTNSQSVTIYAPMTIYAQWAILAPSVPTISVTGGNTTATISITSSETNTVTAGAPNSYTVTAYSGTTASGTCTVIPVATSCIITGLTNGTAYTFKAVATNTTGSATSLASAAVTPAPFTVTYNAGSVGAVTTTSVNTTYNAGTPVTLPTPTAAGYTFTGWYTAATGGSFVGSPNSSYSPASSTTLYATWTANTYTISYDANGGTGTTPSNGSYQTGGTVYPIAAGTGISKAGYTFTAWNTAIDGTGTTYTPPVNYSTPAALTLYAKWAAISQTITYASNGGGSSVPTQTSLIIGQTFTVASGSALSKANYTFGGWSDGTNIYLAGATYTIATSNVTLTAQWTPVQYVVTYEANGGTGSAPVDVTHAATTTVTVLAVGSLTRDGYSFAGWSDGTTTYQASNTFAMPASNITLTAQWSPATFTITYSNNTGTGSASRTTDSFLNGSPTIGLPTIGTLAKAGYTFAGWSETNTVTATAIVGSYAPTKSITLYAVWSPGTYAITYNSNGASGSPTGATTSYTTGTTGVTLPGATGMTKSGYTLSGWSLTPTGSIISGAFAPTTDTTVYAIWTAASISVSYVANITATSGAVAIPPSGTKVFGTSFNIPAPDSATVTNSTGDYAFAGWFDGTSIYNANASYLMGASPVTFTAQWVKIYTLHYVLNGGVAVTPGDFDDHQYINNQTVTISASAPRRDGYTFNGWLDQSSTSVSQGASNFVIGDTHYILTAQWIEVSYAITYNSDGGSAVSGSTTVSGTYGSTVQVADAPTKTGYTFLGWSDTHATYGAGTSYIMPASVVAFTALWSANLYHVTFDLNGGTSSAITQGDTAYQGTFTIPSTVPTKTGYNFTHWLYNSTNYDTNTVFTMPNNNVTFVAQWSIATYSIAYAVNGGSSTPPSHAPVAFGSTFTIDATPPTYASRTFLGWNDGANTYGAGATYTMGTVAITLTAVWSGSTYAVSYGLSGGTGTIPTAQLSASPGTVTLAGSTGFSKSGFTFSTWSDGTTSYAAGASFSVPTHNTSLIAVWVVALPVTPTAPTPVAGNGQATITLGSPAASGGGAVSTYTITASPGGATCTVTSPATSCIITGLNNGTPYTFTSTATNSTGSSSPSSASSSVTPATIPDYPANITALPGNASAIVSWSPPANTGGSPILSYTVTATSGQSCTVSAPTTTCTITGLTNGVPVDFVLTATNAVGTSLPSPDPTITPANVPGAPASVSATAASGTTASVTVGAATDNGGNAITNYTITANSSTGATVTTTVTAAQIANPVLMTGLTPGSAYTFTAVATNQVGSGTGTTSSSVTQPAVAPSAPTISSAIASSTTAAAIAVTAPTSNGGAAISGYVATLTPVGGGAPVTLTTNTSSTSLSVTGLNPGTTYTVAVAAKNSAGSSPASSTTRFTTPLGISTSVATLSATYGTPITPITTAISAASPTGATYSVSPTLPAGLTLDATTGVISGTPTAAVSSSTFTISVSATVSGGATSTGSATVSIGVAAILPTAPAIVYATVINSSSASVRITAPSSNGGSPITKYTITATPVGGGSTITQDASSISSPVALIGLTDTTNYTISVTATNGVGTGPSTTMTGSITTPTPSPTITSVSPTTGSGAGGTSVTITGTNLIQGSSPTTVTFDGNPCTITGTPRSTSITCTTPADAPGPADVVVTTPDSQQVTAAAAFTYYAPVSATTALATKAIEVGVAVAAFTPVTAADGIAPITYAIAPSLPAGLSFNTSTGAITGTLTAPSGTSTFVITATDSTAPTPESSSSSFTLTGNPALSALGSTTPVSLTAGVPATPFTPITVSNGVAPVTYSVSPALPAGLTLNPATGQITGTPISAVASGTYTITATDAAGGTSHADFTLEVAPGPLTANTSVASTSATQNSAITPFTPVTVAGGTAPFTYSVSPALPAGLTLNPATGRISGTPTEVLAITTFTLTATDSGSPAQSVSSNFTLGVVAAPVAPAPAVVVAPVRNPVVPVVPVAPVAPAPIFTPIPVHPARPPVAKPTPTPKPTPSSSPSPSVTPSNPAPVTPAPAPSSKPTLKPTVKPTPVSSPSASAKPTPKPSASPTVAKPLEIAPKVGDKSASVAINNLKPGQKIKVTITQGKSATINKPAPAKKSDSVVEISPETDGNRANVGIMNLKPGQKIKVTIKDGAKK